MCFPPGRYSGELTANVAGQTWLLDSAAVLTGRVLVDAERFTIRGGRIERGSSDGYSHQITILASRATVEEMVIVGEGFISLHSDLNAVRNNVFTGTACARISLWGGSDGADDNLIEGNRISGTRDGCSAIISRGSEGPPPYPVFNRRNIVRNNVVDNGWIAIEFVRSPDTLIEGNTVVGRDLPREGTLVSLPDSDRSIVRGNTLVSLGGDWGVEIAASNDVVVENNDIRGIHSASAAINHNSGSSGSVIRNNRVRDYSAFIDLGSRGLVTGNCLTNVAETIRFDDGTNALERNGPCP